MPVSLCDRLAVVSAHVPGQAKGSFLAIGRRTVAQHTPAHLGAQRVPTMSASTLDERMRPVELEPTPIWLKHRMERRHMTESTSAPRRAREWFSRLARRAPEA